MGTGPTNSSKPTTSQPVAGVYNATTPAPNDTQAIALQVDDQGNLLVNVAVGGGGGVSTVKIEDSTGAALLSNGAGALQVDVVSGGNASVGLTGVIAPTSATEIGVIDNSGKLQGASASNPVRVDPTGTTVQPVSGTVAVSNFPATQPVSGTVVAEIEGHAGATLDSAAGTPNAQAVTVQGNASGVPVPVSGTVAVSGTVPVSGTVAVTQASGANLHVDVDNFPGTQPVSGTVVAEIEGHAGATLDSAAGTPNSQAVTIQGNASGVPVPISGSVTATVASTTITGTVTVVQPTGANLHVDVDNFPTTQPVSGTVTADIVGHAGAVLDGTAGTPSVGVVTVQGVAGGTPQPVSGTVAVSNFPATQPVAGALTNNNAAPAATNLGVLPAIAETAYTTVTYTTGDQVLPVTDLHGALNTDLQAVGGTAVVTAAAGIQKVGISGATGVTMDGIIAAATAPLNGLAILSVYESTVPVLTNGQSCAVQADTTGSTYMNNEGRKATYSGQVNSTTGISGNNFVLTGSASKVIRITRIIFSGVATAATTTVVGFTIVSSAFTGGTSSTAGVVIGQYDSATAAATATAKFYSVTPTGGGATQSYPVIVSYTFGASTTTGNIYTWDFGNRASGCIVLRGVAQQFSLYIGTAPVGCIYSCTYEWTEE